MIPGEDVKIHYLGWNQKWDKVIKLTSPSVRYNRPETKEVKLNFKVGQKVMARFVDGNMYAGILFCYSLNLISHRIVFIPIYITITH